MKYVLLVVLMIVFCISAQAEPIYEKLSDTEFKCVETTTDTVKTVYSIKVLLRDKTNVLERIESIKKGYKGEMLSTKKRLAEIEALIEKAEELGIVAY